jgi:tRNA pseudouridine55 synthase
VLDRVAMRLTRGQVADAAGGFLGERDQIPPMVSAIKIGGRRLHELARKGEEVERPPRRVRVDRFDVDGFTDGAYPEADVTVECSSGTYVRSLAADLGVALGGCAHLRDLRRLRVGAFGLDEAHPLEAVEADPSAVVVTPADALRGMARVTVTGEEARAVSHGAVFAPPGLTTCTEAGPFAVVDLHGALLAVYERKGAALKAAMVMPEAAS